MQEASLAHSFGILKWFQYTFIVSQNVYIFKEGGGECLFLIRFLLFAAPRWKLELS